MKVKRLGLVLLILMGTGCYYNYEKLEEEMTTKASSYYEEYLKGYVVGVDQHKITLEDLKNKDYNINNFIKRKCELDSYVLIKLEADEQHTDNDNYDIENHLTCKGYQTR